MDRIDRLFRSETPRPSIQQQLSKCESLWRDYVAQTESTVTLSGYALLAGMSLSEPLKIARLQTVGGEKGQGILKAIMRRSHKIANI